MLCNRSVSQQAPRQKTSSLSPFACRELFGGLPVTARSKNKHGVRVEDGKVVSRDYTGPMLERAIAENAFIKRACR